MTDSRLERIIGQLAEFDENELNFIVEKICLERQKKRKAKIDKLIENFEKAWDDLITAGIDINYYNDDTGDCYYLNIHNFSFE